MAAATVILSSTRLVGTNTYVPGSIAGADPWIDALTGTYTECASSDRTFPGSLEGFEYAAADLSLPAGVSIATITDLTLEVDLTPSNIGSTGPEYQVDVQLCDAAGAYYASFVGGGLLALAGDVMQTVITNVLNTVSPNDVLPALDGGTVRVSRLINADGDVPADYVVRCHRLVLTVTYEPGGLEIGSPRTTFDRGR